MSQDALERLRNKVKPTVESRDLSPVSPVDNLPEQGKPQVTSLPENQGDILASRNQDIEISSLQEMQISTNESKPAKKGSANRQHPDLETKQSTIRLEKELSLRLFQKCQSEEISREVFLEALFVYFENHKPMQTKVLQEARKRDKQRQEIANYRRAKSMIDRFGKV